MNLLFKSKKTNVRMDFELVKYNVKAGKDLEGELIFRKDQPVKISGLRIKIQGTEKNNQPSADIDEKKREKIFYESNYQNLVANKTTVQPGDSNFEFKFRIPENLPPTVNHSYFEIKYEIHAEILFSKGNPVPSKTVFFVHPPEAAGLPNSFTEKKDKGLLSKENVILRVTPDKNIYKPSNPISFDLTITNNTKRDVPRLIIGVERVFKAAKKTEENILSQMEITKPKLPVPPSARYEDVISFNLPAELLPTVPKSTFTSFTISYFLSFKAELGSGGEFVFKMPLTISSSNFPAPEAKKGFLEKEAPEPTLNESLDGSLANHSPPPRIPDRINTSTSDFTIPSALPPLLGATTALSITSILPQTQHIMPYGHPSYFGATTFYKPAPYVDHRPHAQTTATPNDPTAQLMSI